MAVAISERAPGIAPFVVHNPEAANESRDVTSFEAKWIKFSWLNTLPQTRVALPEIVELRDNVASIGLINPLIVGCFDEKGLQRHLVYINKLWGLAGSGGEVKAEDLTFVEEGFQKFWYVIIDGHRRYAALTGLLQDGCSEHGSLCNCYQKHFGNRTEVVVRLGVNPRPKYVVDIQISANRHHQLPPHIDAQVNSVYWQTLKEDDPDLTFKEFCARIGKSPDTVRRQLRYVELPSQIQTWVNQGYFSYALACEITKFKQEGLNISDWELVRLAAVAKAGKHTVRTYKDYIAEYIKHLKGEQLDLPALFTQNQIDLMKSFEVKRQAVAQLADDLRRAIGYFSEIHRLFKEGLLGFRGSPFSEDVPVLLFKRMAQAMTDLLPLMEKHLTAEEHERYLEVFVRYCAIFTVLQERFWERTSSQVSPAPSRPSVLVS